MQVPAPGESAGGADDRAEVGSWVAGSAVCGAEVVLCAGGSAGLVGAICAIDEVGEAGATAGATEVELVGAAAAAAAGAALVLVLVLCETLVVVCPTDDAPVMVDWHAAAVKTVIAQAKADAHLCRSMKSLPKTGARRRPGPHLGTVRRVVERLSPVHRRHCSGPGESGPER